MSQKNALFARREEENLSPIPLSSPRSLGKLLQKPLSFFVISLQHAYSQVFCLHFVLPCHFARTIKNHYFHHHPNHPRRIKPYQNLLIIHLGY